MTVSFLFGWQSIATVVVAVLVVAVLAVVLLQAGRDTAGRSEFQAWLDGRSAGPRDGVAGDGAVQEDEGPSRPSVVVRHRAAWRSPRS
jgi:hypothetical protein